MPYDVERAQALGGLVLTLVSVVFLAVDGRLAGLLAVHDPIKESTPGAIKALHQAGKLAEIREYNLNDVRVTRKVYERMVACFGG